MQLSGTDCLSQVSLKKAISISWLWRTKLISSIFGVMGMKTLYRFQKSINKGNTQVNGSNGNENTISLSKIDKQRKYTSKRLFIQVYLLLSKFLPSLLPVRSVHAFSASL